MKRFEFVRATLLISVAPMLFSKAPAAHAGDVSAAEFVEKAGIAGQFEIASSQIVAASTQNAEIKSFAEQMIKDHTAAAEELKTTAATRFTVPNALDARHQKMIDELKSGGKLADASYVKMQVKAHEEAVKLFGAYSKQGDDAALQAFAVKTLPTLQMHYDMIKRISANQS